MAGGKCYREGKVTRNAFFNYLRTLRKQYCGCTIIEIAVQGGKKWKQMSECEKQPFRDMARCAPKSRRRAKSRRRC